MFVRATYSYFILFLVLLKINALPIISRKHHYYSEETGSDPFYDFFQQTKDLGQQAIDRISDTANSIGTTVSDIAGELFQQGAQQTAGFFSTGHDVVVSNFEEAKRFLGNAMSATTSFFSDIPKFPFMEFRVVDRRDTKADLARLDIVTGLSSDSGDSRI